MSRDYTTSKYFLYKRKIAKDDPLIYEKEDTIRTAIELGYKDETLTQIINAKTENEMYRAMTNARKSA